MPFDGRRPCSFKHEHLLCVVEPCCSTTPLVPSPSQAWGLYTSLRRAAVVVIGRSMLLSGANVAPTPFLNEAAHMAGATGLMTVRVAGDHLSSNYPFTVC